MKKSFYCLVAAMAVLAMASSCGNGGKSDAAMQDAGITSFEVRQSIKTADRNYKVETDYGTVYLDLYTSIHWPERLGNANLKVLQDSLLYFAYGDTASRSVDDAIMAFINDTGMMDGAKEITPIDSLPSDSVERMPVYFNNVTASVLDLDDDMVTYQVVTSSYLGGAHPDTGIHPFTYDMRSGKVLSVDNMFMPEARDSIVPVIVNALARQLDVSPAALDRAGIFSSQLTYAGVPYIANNILYFHYNPYEIAPYSSGMIDVAVYPYEVESMLTPEARSLFDMGY
ncbi:MAG: DUF3298 domain-containing protein [Duncaniella sp.]|nr:DUF3298 domain-containing protein [Duncaniella sp.]